MFRRLRHPQEGQREKVKCIQGPPLLLVASLLLVARLLLVVRPGAPSSVLAPSSNARTVFYT